VETGITKQQIIANLAKSSHRDLASYFPIAREAHASDPEFYAHLISWNRIKGTVRDSKVALPLVALESPSAPEFTDNAAAHLALLPPREFIRALRCDGTKARWSRRLRRLGESILRSLEADRKQWNRTAVQHRAALKSLYAMLHVKPAAFAAKILFERSYPPNSVFAVIANLKNLPPAEAAATVIEHRIPFLIAAGAIGPRLKDTDVLLALIDRMTPAELGNNMKMLERLGVKSNPALRSALEAALSKARDGKSSALKLTKAVESLDDEGLREKVKAVQEAKLSKASVEGDWLVLADQSASMHTAITAAREIAGVLARLAAGKVHLVFFNTMPTYLDVTGKTLDEINTLTRFVTAQGGTSIGCGLKYIMERGIEIDGIAIVSDGGENNVPAFPVEFQKYSQKTGKDVPVYLYRLAGDPNYLGAAMQHAGLDLQMFDLTNQRVDQYSIPNLVQTMRTNRYSLIDEVMAAPLLRLEVVLKQPKKEMAYA
jgi:hypothetical protein